MDTPTMQASFLYGIRDIRLESCSIPAPGPGEVLLQVSSVGVCGSDVHYYLEGRIGGLTITDPLILGHEFSARVAGLGEGVVGLHPGDRVTVDPGISCGECEPCQQGHPNLCAEVRFCGTPPTNGVFAEYALMPARNCHLLPEGIGTAEGALLEPLGIAVHSVSLSHLKPGDTVAVLGAGPIGLLTAAVARAAGASAVYLTDPLAYRRKFGRDYIADAVFNPDEADVAAEVKRLTGGRGVDIVFEAAGVSATPQQAAEIVRIGGKVILVGIPVEDEVFFRASTLRRKGLTIKLVRRMKHIYPRALRLVQTGQVDLKPLITHCFPLSQVGQAMELVAGYQDGVIKAVIQIYNK